MLIDQPRYRVELSRAFSVKHFFWKIISQNYNVLKELSSFKITFAKKDASVPD